MSVWTLSLVIVVALIWIGLAAAVAHLVATKVGVRPGDAHDVFELERPGVLH